MDPSISSNPLFGATVRSILGELQRSVPPPEPLQVVERLRRVLPAETAREAAALLALRLRSRRKYPRHPPPFLTRKGLEQASAERVADERARLVAERLPGAVVLDATAGIGADTLAVARRGLTVVAADRDPFLVACVRANLLEAELEAELEPRTGLGAEADAGPEAGAGAGLDSGAEIDARAKAGARAGRVVRGRAHVVVADAERPCVRADVVLLDPDRRAGGKRTLDPARWSPPLAGALRVAARFGGACIKLAPAFDPDAFPDLPAGASLRWISLDGELAEVALLTGALADPDAAPDANGARTAVRLAGPVEHAVLTGRPETVAAWPAEALAGLAWFAEPDPAAIRAGLIGTLARAHGLRPLAPRCAYLGGDAAPDSSFLRAWRVLGSASVDARRVRALLERHDVGPLTVKKRGHPEDAETLARKLRGPGSRRGLLAIARLERGHRAFLLAEAPVADPG